ncbi:MAG: hypothetical protein RL272_526 [Candidatus Parcubacteria bacterium]|jgi:hypothetical protein
MKTRLAIFSAVAALLLAGAGCGKSAAPQPAQPPVNRQAQKPASPGLPRMTQQTVDEDDHLDAALKDLDTVE